MSSFRRFFRAGALFIAVGYICSTSVIQAVPLLQEGAETPVSASSEQVANPLAETRASKKYQNLFPDVVATVNGEPVSGRDLERIISEELASIGSPEWKNLREDYRGNLVYGLITQLVNSKLLFEKAAASGTNVTDAEVQDEYLRLTKAFENDEEMNAFLEDRNISSEKMIENIHQSLLIQKYIEETIRSKIMVTPEEMEKYYSDNPDQFRHPEIVRTSHIMIASGDGEKVDEIAKQRIDELMARLGKGEDFAALAREHSMSPSASQGGDVGYAAREMLPAEYAEAAFSLPIGGTRIVKAQEGYFIVKVTGKKEAGVATLDDSKDQLAEFLRNEKTQKELQRKINQLRDEADIEILIPAGPSLEQ